MKEQQLVGLLGEFSRDCPSNGALIEFEDGSLDEELRAEIAQHVQLCGRCANALRLLRDSETAPPSSSIESKEIEQRLRDRFKEKLGPSKTSRRSMRVPRSVAAGILLVLGLPVYWSIEHLFLESKPVESVGTVISLPRAVRSPGAEAETISAPAGEPFFGLSFFVPVSDSKDVRYDYVLVDGAGEIVYSDRNVKSFDELGNFLLVVSSAALREGGSYRLIVRETNLASGERTWEYPFRVSK